MVLEANGRTIAPTELNTAISHHIEQVRVCRNSQLGLETNQLGTFTQRVAAAQLRLLGIFCCQLVTDTIQQLDITLLRVLSQCRDKRPRHGTGSLSGNLGVLAGLVVLAAGPHDDIRRTGLGLFAALICLVTLGSFLEKAHCGGHHATHIAARVRRYHTEQALSGFFGKIRLLEHTRGGVDVWEVQRGTRVTRIENCRQAYTRLQ